MSFFFGLAAVLTGGAAPSFGTTAKVSCVATGIAPIPEYGELSQRAVTEIT